MSASPSRLRDLTRACTMLSRSQAPPRAASLVARVVGLATLAAVTLAAVTLVAACWLLLATPARAATPVATAGAVPLGSAPLGAAPLGPGAAIPFPLFPTDNPWNTRVDTLPVDPNSADYLASIGLDTGLHPDFGTVWDGAPIGIPYVCVSGTQPKVPVSFDYDDESDPGPYPVPSDAPIEGGPSSDGDRHVLVLDVDAQRLYELYAAYPRSNGSWTAGSGAVFDLTSNALRPAGWTSADAAGLPILPGLVRYDEAVTEGVIDHALRFTVVRTQRAYVYPATHYASSSTDLDLPPMGLRVRLRASYDISGFSPEVQVILQALKTYGMMVADNGSNWYVSGAPDSRWSDDDLRELSQVKGRDFEVVDARSLQPGAIVVSAGGDATVREGQRLSRVGSFVDEGSGATGWTASVDYGGGAGAQPLALAADHSFTLAHIWREVGRYVVTVRVAGAGASGSRAGLLRFTVTCRNAPPRIAPLAAATVRRGATLRRVVRFTDPGADTWRARLAWGDGSGWSRRPLGRAHRFTIGHVFHRTGRFTVTVKVFDQHGAYGLRRFRVTVRP